MPARIGIRGVNVMSRFATSHVAARVRALCIAASLVSLVTAAHADPLSGPGPLADQHAPAGVMFDHMHKAGEIMVEFRYAGSFAGGSILHGEKSASDQEIIDSGLHAACLFDETDRYDHEHVHARYHVCADRLADPHGDADVDEP